MNDFVHLQTIADLFKFFNLDQDLQHPLVAVVDFGRVNEQVHAGKKVSADFYTIMFKNYSRNNIKYGRKNIDFQDGSA